MRIDKIKFSKIKLEWNITQMKSAYILAEREIVQDPRLTGWEQNTHVEHTNMSPQAFWDTFNEPKLRDIQIAKLEAQISEIEETGRRLLEEEKYELLDEAKEIWKKLKEQLNNLRSL